MSAVVSPVLLLSPLSVSDQVLKYTAQWSYLLVVPSQSSSRLQELTGKVLGLPRCVGKSLSCNVFTVFLL